MEQVAGWGGAIGAGMGFGYALIHTKGPGRDLALIVDAGLGFTAGIVGGSIVYFVRRATR